MVLVGIESENGWRPAKISANNLDRRPIPGTTIIVPLMPGIPAALLKAFLADVHEFVESLYNSRGGTDEGGWTPTNSVATSNHLNGTACDFNWEDHTFRVSYAGFTEAEIAEMRKLLAFYNYRGIQLVFWAQDWDNPKDCMHIQMGYNTWQNQAICQEFIDKFIRPDGFSTYRRGGEKPSLPRKLVQPAGGGTFWTDVSQFQGKPIDSSYESKVFSFRTNSGDVEDTLAIQNATVAKELLDSGKLEIVIPYYFFRPGQENCDLHREILERASLFNHPRTVTMVDVEGDRGSVSGNNSWEINDEVGRIRSWYSNYQRVIGYLNSNADPGLWPTRAGINLVVPQYGRTPGDISSIQDGSVKVDAIAHQFTETAKDVAPWTGQNVDRNWSPYSVDELLVLFGMEEIEGVMTYPSQEKMIQELYDQFIRIPWFDDHLWPSRAVFRDSDDGVDKGVGMLLNTDGNAWDTKVLLGAMLGDEKMIARIKRVADGQGPSGDNPAAVKFAQGIYKELTEGAENG